MTAPITTARAAAGAAFPQHALPERRDHASGRGCSRATTSASASCSWSRSLVALFLGGVFAMLIRLELLTPGPTHHERA